jgi:hypothetical protein
MTTAPGCSSRALKADPGRESSGGCIDGALAIIALALRGLHQGVKVKTGAVPPFKEEAATAA